LRPGALVNGLEDWDGLSASNLQEQHKPQFWLQHFQKRFLASFHGLLSHFSSQMVTPPSIFLLARKLLRTKEMLLRTVL